MGEKTGIAWTSATFNIVHGCMKVSPGCAACYAEDLTQRRYDKRIWGPAGTTERRTFGEKHWNDPRRWNRQAAAEGKRRRVFSSSMGDNFENHPTVIAELAKLWPLIRETPWLDWQLLTKRHDRIALSLPPFWDDIKSHVWLGVSIENNDYVHRADALRALDPAVRFVSYEPALGPLDKLNLDGIDWLIYGGESGPHFRPEDKQWARDMYARCKASGTAFFHKQSSARRTEMGIELDGKIVRFYPSPRHALAESLLP
jgi:protein gp37